MNKKEFKETIDRLYSIWDDLDTFEKNGSASDESLDDINEFQERINDLELEVRDLKGQIDELESDNDLLQAEIEELKQ